MAGSNLTQGAAGPRPAVCWHIITGEYPPDPGGVSDYTAQVAAALRQRGDEVHICRYPSHEIGPGRLLLQWVPHSFGYRSMNLPLCLWLATRKQPLDIMIHEPCYAFGEGGWKQDAVATVHRMMLALLLHKAERVFLSIPAWEPRLRPLTRRDLAFTWLPVPSNIPVVSRGPEIHDVGYFGQYDSASIAQLTRVLDLLPCRVLLLGRGAERVPAHDRAIPIGERAPSHLSREIASCRVMLHIYPDGVSGRRTTAMASLAHGKAVVTNEGRLSENIWRESGAVALASGAEEIARATQSLLADDAARQSLGCAALRLYEQRFSLAHTIRALTS